MENLKPKDWEQSQSNNQFVDVDDVYEEEDYSAMNAGGFMAGFIIYFIVYVFASGGFDMEYFFLSHIYAWLAISVFIYPLVFWLFGFDYEEGEVVPYEPSNQYKAVANPNDPRYDRYRP